MDLAIERAARAIYRELCPVPVAWDDATDAWRKACRSAARAALQSLQYDQPAEVVRLPHKGKVT
jgi:hypothetical protein